MRYNPCGRYVEMMRRPYQIPCRFLRDSDVTSTLKWVEAREDALPLDKVSIIASEDWDNDRGMWPDRLGEQDGVRTFRAATAPAGSGRGHVCGTDEEFELGGTYEPDLPPVQYDSFSLPLCCGGPRRSVGGAGSGGRSVVVVKRPLSYGGAGASGLSPVSRSVPVRVHGGAGASGRSPAEVRPPIAVYGGAGASGRSPAEVRPPIAVYGGAGASGSSQYTVTAPCAGGGFFCTVAQVETLGVGCYFHILTKIARWWRWDVVVGETYLFELWATVTGGQPWTLFEGTDCDSLNVLAAAALSVPYQTSTITPTTGHVWLRIGAPGPGPDAQGVFKLSLVP